MKSFFRTHIIFSLCILLSIQACSKFDDINTNPNATEKVTPALLATYEIMDIMKPGAGKNFVYHNMASKQLAWGEGAEGYQYNDFGRTDFTDYLSLANINKMIESTTDVNKDAYTGLGLFLKAYRLFYLSMSLGDIPYSDAANKDNSNMTPKYDQQKDVMLQVLQDLKDSDQHFSVASNFDGDPLHGGNVIAWRRIVNSFRLKVLMYLSNKESDPDLKVKETFSQIISGNPVLENNDQNMQLVYSNKAGQIYPFNKVNTNHYGYGIISSVLVDNLKKLNDYRLFYFAEPAGYSIETDGKSVDDWDAYPGIDPSMPFEDLKALHNAKKYCGFNSRYIYYEPGEPLMRIGYTEQCFIIAEAIVRGWISGNALDYYNAGIRAAMTFIASSTPATYCHNREITGSYIESYLTGSEVAFATSKDDQLKQIWMQKYILYFMQHLWDSYYEYRRTGYPALPVNPLTNRNEVKDKIPVRWMYPQKEYNMNLDNLSTALDRQFNGQDKVNNLMWILQ